MAYHKAGINKELQKQKLATITLVHSCIIWNTIPTVGIRPDLLALKHLDTRITRIYSVAYHWQYTPWSVRREQCRGTHIINLFRMTGLILTMKRCRYRPVNFISIIKGFIQLHVLKKIWNVAKCFAWFRVQAQFCKYFSRWTGVWDKITVRLRAISFGNHKKKRSFQRHTGEGGMIRVYFYLSNKTTQSAA